MHLSLTLEGKLYGGSWSAITGPALIPLPAGNTTIPLNQWSHVAYVWGESGTSLYFNGVQDSFSPDNLYPALNSTFYAYVPYWGYPGIGYIDDLRITSSSQTSFGVTALAEGESITCNGSYVVTQNDVDAGSVTNTAQAHAFVDTTPLDSNQDTVTATLAQQPPVTSPVLSARIPDNAIVGREWTLGESVTLTIDDPETSQAIDYSETRTVVPWDWDPSQTEVWFNLNNFLLEPGQVLTMTNGTVTKVHTVIDLKITNVNIDADTVSGTTNVLGGEIEIYSFGNPATNRIINVNQDGTWLADFAVPHSSQNKTSDLRPGDISEALHYDEDGDYTLVRWIVPPAPLFMLNVNNASSWGGLDAWNWPLGSDVTMTVNDPNTIQNPDYTEVQTMGQPSDGGHTSHAMFLQDNNFEGHPGFTITLSDGIQTKTMIVPLLAVSGYDLDADTISGVSDPFTSVVAGCTESMEPTVIAGNEGNWLASYRDPENPDIVIYDIQPGSACEPQIYDADWDHIVLRDWRVPKYGTTFWFFPEINSLESGNWPLNEPIHLLSDDPSTPQNPDYDYIVYAQPADPGRGVETWLNLTLPPEHIIVRPGFTLTISGGGQSRSYVISSVHITSLDVMADTIEGYSEPASLVVVNVDETGALRRLIADQNGYWLADFSILGNESDEFITDIKPGFGGLASVWNDGDLGATAWQWTVPNPFIIVQPEEDRVFGFDWPVGALLELEIDDPVTPQIPDYTASQIFIESDDWGNGFELGGLFDIQPGHLVTVSDGTTTRQHTVTNLAVTNIDVDADTVSGTGYPGAMIHVGTVCDDTGCASRNINVDENGIWIADFSVPVIGHGDAGMVFDLRPGMGSGAYEFDADEDSTNVSWQILNPIVSVHQDEDWLEGYDWPTGVTVNISIDDPSTPQNPDKTGSAVVGTSDWNPSENYFSFDLSNIYDIKAGFQVVVSGGGVTKEHEVTNLVVTNVNAADDTVSGTSDPNAHLRVDIHNTNGVQMEIDSNSNGDWLADFTGQFDLKPGDSGRVQEYDDDWDNTGDSWRIPNPSIGVRANNDQVEGWEWPLDATITVTVDDPTTPASPDITRTAVVYEASWNPGEYRFDLNLYGQMDIQPGFVVIATLDDITKTLIVTPLAFTDVDIDLDLMTGIAEPGSRVDVWTCGNNYCANRHVTADSGGVWSADFAHPGLENDEQDTIDIVIGTWIDSSQREDDGDQTMFGQSVPNPFIEASPNSNWIHARDWPIGTLVTMNISGSSQTYTATIAQASWNPNDPNDIVAEFDLQGYDIQSGDVITASADGITKVLTLSQLSVTEFNNAADMITGIATPGVQIQVCANIENRCITRWVTADASGVWTANYHDPGTGNDDPDTFDVQAGSNGWAAEYEADSDRTWYDWQVPNPNFAVHPDENVIEGNEWPLESIVTIKIGDPVQPKYTTTTTINPPDQDHNLPWFDLDLSDIYDLLPGELITMSDTVTTKQVIAASRSITLIDPLTDTITGVSDPGVVYVVLWACDENGCATRRKDVNPDGSWSVNFAVPGELNWESIIMDIQPSTNGGVYQSDVDGDGTVYQWILNQPPHADLGPDLVTDEATTLMLDASASSDPEAGSLTYEWDLDNDGEYDDAGGVTVNRTFPDNGAYIISLKVTDEYGAFDFDTLKVTVNNISPLVDIQHISAIGLSVSGNGSFTDPGADLWTATVNYGDGSGVQPLALSPAKSFLLNHAYIAGGIYTVEVCVSDDDSASGCDQAQVTVTLNRPPVAEAGGPYVGYEGTSITLNASRSTDPDNNIVLYEWDFDNDSQFDDATGIKPKFKAADNGVFTVRVRVTDAGRLSSVDSSTVIVKNLPPIITSLTFNNSVRVGVKLNTLATFKDAGVNDTFTATWKWGDGTTSTGTVSGKTVIGSHTYTKPGIYLVTITVKDKDGGVGQFYKLIIVLPKK